MLHYLHCLPFLEQTGSKMSFATSLHSTTSKNLPTRQMKEGLQPSVPWWWTISRAVWINTDECADGLVTRMASCLIVSPAGRWCVLRLSCYASVILKKNDLRVREKTSNLYGLLELIRGQNSSFNLCRSPGIIPSELSDDSCWNLSCEVRHVRRCPSPGFGHPGKSFWWEKTAHGDNVAVRFASSAWTKRSEYRVRLRQLTQDLRPQTRPLPPGQCRWRGRLAGFRVTWCKRIQTRAAIIQISSVIGIRAAICWPLPAHAAEPRQTLAVSSYPWLHPKRTLELILSTPQRSTRGRAFTSCHRPYWFIFARIRTST